MLKNVRVTFIGGGVMAEAMIKGLLAKALVAPAQIVVAEPRTERAVELRAKYRVNTQTDNLSAVEGAGVIVLAVKPQVLGEALAALKGRIPRQALVLSIAAGARISTIVDGLAHPAVVRSMPNTPAQVAQGMTVWSSAPGVTPNQQDQVRAILGALGVEVYMEDEDYLDKATALSGSGPAYVFLFMEALVEAGVQLGFTQKMAEQLVLQTMKGSVEYALQAQQDFSHLRKQVTSPGGTTAEALDYLDKAGFRTAISGALWAAYQKSIQLGQEKKRDNGEKD